MNQNKVGKTSIASVDYWKNLILFAVICFFIVYIIELYGFRSVGDDYLGYWSVGKIADQKGFSEIYDIENLRIVQSKALDLLGYSGNTNENLYSPM
ncbi:MAG: hypothetical protein AAGU75_18370, partial [Bacillota bacterium]